MSELVSKHLGKVTGAAPLPRREVITTPKRLEFMTTSLGPSMKGMFVSMYTSESTRLSGAHAADRLGPRSLRCSPRCGPGPSKGAQGR